MDPAQNFFDQALEYFKEHLGGPDPTRSAEPHRVSWALPESGTLAKTLRVEMEPDAAGGGVRVTVADPLAFPPHRFETFTARSPDQLEVVLTLVLDHLSSH